MEGISSFGTLDGQSVPQVFLSTPSGISLSAIGYGAALQSLCVPDRNKKPVDVCLGYDTLLQYQQHDGCLGATVGRCANRIANASFSVDGEVFSLDANEGRNTLHSGAAGFHRRVWEVKALTKQMVCFRLRSPHLDGGFPGALEARVTYSLCARSLFIRYEALSDRDTVVNLTNHSYWNLSGAASGSALSHHLTLDATRYTPTRADGIPTGVLCPTAGLPLDFLVPTRLGERIDHPMLAETRGYDHNYEILGEGMRRAALLESDATGIQLALFTTQPGLQLYTANYLTEREGKGGAIHRPHDGVCLETQHYPDAAHHPAFPSTLLRAGTRYLHQAEYRFGCSN